MGNSPWKVTPAVLNLPKQLSYSFLYFCSYIKKKKKFQGLHITFANFEREGKPAEAKLK